MLPTRSDMRSTRLMLTARGLLITAIVSFVAGCGAPESSSPSNNGVATAEPVDEVQTVKTATLHLVFEDAVLRSPLPGVDKTVGYVTLRNVGSSDVVLTGAQSESFRTIELHTMIRDGEMMRMRRLDQVEVPAGEAIAFERGGKHLMIFGLGEMADTSEIVFLTANDEHLPVRFATVAVTDG